MREHGREALLIVDVQNDFCAGGALAVPDGDAVVPVINRAARALAGRGALIVASRDWHPRSTAHFETQGGPWPVHCVAGTPGAQFHPGLELPPGIQVVTKGDTPADHGYSAFEGHLASGEPLADLLARQHVDTLWVAGLATDYCVKHSVIDARRLGLEVVVLSDAVRAVDVTPGDAVSAVNAMAEAGARFEPSSAVTVAQGPAAQRG